MRLVRIQCRVAHCRRRAADARSGHVVRRQRLGSGPRSRTSSGGHRRRERPTATRSKCASCAQGRAYRGCRAGPCSRLVKPVGQPVQGRRDVFRSRAQRMRIDDQHAEVRQSVVARRRQRKPVADAVPQLVRAGKHRKRERKVGRAARHRADHREIAATPAMAGVSGGPEPRCGTRSRLGLCENTPQKCAGARSEPPMSEPSSRGTNPAASAAAAPPDEPPGVRPRSHGLLVVP